jgi:hypothetical protein
MGGFLERRRVSAIDLWKRSLDRQAIVGIKQAKLFDQDLWTKVEP